jgi:hypothetical protein
MTVEFRSNGRLEVELRPETKVERAFVGTMLEATAKGAAVHLEASEKLDASSMTLVMAKQ